MSKQICVLNNLGGNKKMAVVEQLIRSEKDGTISFGNHKLEEKAKVEDFNHAGDLYKVKTSKHMTKLEKNGMFAYESVPGTSVNKFKETVDGISFIAEGDEDAQIIIGLEDETEYEVFIDGKTVGKMNTGLGGKIDVSTEFTSGKEIQIIVKK
jgi:hypothetical protein